MKWTLFNPEFNYEALFRDHNYPWAGHKLFGYDLVRNLKPKLIVELGTENGTSFFSFCQALLDESLDTKLVAIDTWQGDINTGNYNNSVFKSFSRILTECYSKLNIKILKLSFDEGLQHFEDHSIDILHIDGCHTYEAVKHDYTTWLPKVKQQGIILIHDTMVRLPNFGVFQFWDEISKTIQYNFNFPHSNGLGVLNLNIINKTNCPISESTNNLLNYYNLYALKEESLGKAKRNEQEILKILEESNKYCGELKAKINSLDSEVNLLNGKLYSYNNNLLVCIARNISSSIKRTNSIARDRVKKLFKAF